MAIKAPNTHRSVALMNEITLFVSPGRVANSFASGAVQGKIAGRFQSSPYNPSPMQGLPRIQEEAEAVGIFLDAALVSSKRISIEALECRRVPSDTEGRPACFPSCELYLARRAAAGVTRRVDGQRLRPEQISI